MRRRLKLPEPDHASENEQTCMRPALHTPPGRPASVFTAYRPPHVRSSARRPGGRGGAAVVGGDPGAGRRGRGGGARPAPKPRAAAAAGVCLQACARRGPPWPRLRHRQAPPPPGGLHGSTAQTLSCHSCSLETSCLRGVQDPTPVVVCAGVVLCETGLGVLPGLHRSCVFKNRIKFPANAGKRKCSIARCWIEKGEGTIKINGRTLVRWGAPSPRHLVLPQHCVAAGGCTCCKEEKQPLP